MRSITVLASTLLLGAALASPYHQPHAKRQWPDEHNFNTSSTTTTTTTTTSSTKWWPETSKTTDKEYHHSSSTTSSSTATDKEHHHSSSTTTSSTTTKKEHDWDGWTPVTTKPTDKPHYPPHTDKPHPPKTDKPQPPKTDKPHPPKTDKPQPPKTDKPQPPKTDKPKNPWDDAPPKTITVTNTNTVTVTVTEKPISKPTGGADKPQPAPPCAPSKPTPPILEVDINVLIEAYTFILVNPGHPKFNETAKKFLHKDFKLISDSINVLSGKSVGSVTFSSLVEFIEFQAFIAPLGGFKVSYYSLSYTEKTTTLTLKWAADKIGSAVSVVSGFIDLQIVLVNNQWTIIEVNAEFNTYAFLLNFGGKCELPSPPSKKPELPSPPSKKPEGPTVHYPTTTKAMTTSVVKTTEKAKVPTTTPGWGAEAGPFKSA